MLIEEAKTCRSLQQIIARFTSDTALQQDLMQECLVHLWRVERQEPGRTQSWYLQSCRFFVQHCLAAGRSVDSLKRTRGDRLIRLSGTADESTLPGYHTDGELFEAVSFQDVVSTLNRYLQPRERQVLRGLAEGRKLREIAAQLRLSYPTALKSRRAIATITLKLGLPCNFAGDRNSQSEEPVSVSPQRPVAKTRSSLNRSTQRSPEDLSTIAA